MFIAYISLDPFDAAILKVMAVPQRYNAKIFGIYFVCQKNKRTKVEVQ